MKPSKKPRLLQKWYGTAMIAIIIIGLSVGIILPLSVSVHTYLTYWLVYYAVAFVFISILIAACIIDKCWRFLGTMCFCLAIILIIFFVVILPNI